MERRYNSLEERYIRAVVNYEPHGEREYAQMLRPQIGQRGIDLLVEDAKERRQTFYAVD